MLLVSRTDIAQGLAEWVADDDKQRRATTARLKDTIASLTVSWAVSEAEVLWFLWEGGTVTVFPRVGRIARLVEGRLQERDAT